MRLDGWEIRLAAVIEHARNAPYALGEHDCFRVACRAVEALSGKNHWPQFAGRYATRAEALRLIARHGSSFEEAFSWLFGSDAVDVRRERRGDIVCIQTEEGEKHLGVCVGAESAFTLAAGSVYLPTLSCLCCWRIG